MGTPDSSISLRAASSAGQRIATVARPPVVSSGTQGFFGSTMVRGPGQIASASFHAFSGTVAASASISSAFAMCTISGLSEGLPLAA